ncbi:CDP-glycerol glycerophosphotransferase family protein [Streptomyces sp. NPDC047097]|uniref:CDP-glycerol glycerophosphotransferase family protein n=1 Tax=Streptomyces sp. NPDC047097 TaxID=3155260 RepID=UPI0033E4DEDD
MPTLSVIVSGPAPLGRFRACLDSLTTQHSDALDLVVAVPGDDPAALALAARRELADPQLTVLTVPAGTTAAAARATAVRSARGQYVQFLDPATDRLPAGAADALAERLLSRRAPAPDVLLCDHLTAHWWDPAVPSAATDLLTSAPATTTLADHPELLDVPPLLGDRVIRRGLLTEHPGLLDTDGHDALYLSYAVLLLARTAARCGTAALVRHRDRPTQPGSGAATPLAVFGQYEALHQLAVAADAPAAVRARLYDRMTADYLTTLARREELPPALIGEFFGRAARHTAEYRPAGHPRPGGLDGVRHLLLARNLPLGYRLLRTANDRRRAARSLAGAAAGRAAAARTALRRRIALARPLDADLAVFSAYWGRGAACNPAAIAAELAELAPDIRQVWVVEAEHAELLPPGTDHVVPGSRRHAEVLARAKYLVNNVNFPDGVRKRPGSVHIQTHHGTPLKHMGVDLHDHPAAARGLDFDKLLERVDRWDFSLSANPHSTEVWQRAYPSGHQSLDYGYPRNDVYYRATSADVRAARARLGLAPGTRALLYAPTHRDHEARPVPRLDLHHLAEELGEDTVLLVRGHYFHAPDPWPAGSRGVHPRVLDVTGWDPVEDLALAADALVTDYSSIMFDYANLDRPIVLLADDWDTYRAVRGVYFDITADPPGPVARGQDELTAVLTDGGWCDEAAAKLRHDFRLRFCAYDDGRAAERVVRRVFLGEGEESLPPVLPLARRTPAPTPEEAAREAAPVANQEASR